MVRGVRDPPWKIRQNFSINTTSENFLQVGIRLNSADLWLGPRQKGGLRSQNQLCQFLISDFGLQIADCGFFNPHSAFRNRF